MLTLASLSVCAEGVVATTRDLIRSHPRQIYRTIVEQLGAATNSFSVYYMELLMSAAYGPVQTAAP